jgi:PAS domain S-box-containing protein
LLAAETFGGKPRSLREGILAEFADRDVVDTVRDGLLVLDANLVVVFASRSFYRMFSVVPEETEGKKLYDLGDRQWDIPALRHLLEKIVPEQTTVEAYEVEHNFPVLGPRVMLLNARRIVREGNKDEFLLLAIDDITERRKAERERDVLSRRLHKASQESAHRIKNSLTLLSSFVRD